MFDRRQIMIAAWEHYRWVRESYAPWQIERGIVEGTFANALRIAWRIAKEAAAEAKREIQLATGPSAVRAAEIRSDLDGLTYRSLRYDVPAMRRALEAELEALA